MMNGSVPDWDSSPRVPGFAGAVGGLATGKSGMSGPAHFEAAASQYMYFLRSLHGVPSGRAEARLYMMRRLAGHEKAQLRLLHGWLPASGVRLAGLKSPSF